jgi:predicted Zn finger-like uncharacterized protein
MIVTCPTCSTRYLVDPRALGSSGRTVRCTQCSHTWQQTPPEDAPRRVDLPGPDENAPLAATEVVPPTRPNANRGVTIPLAIAIVVIALAAILWFERNAVAQQWPGAAAFYAMLGIPVGDPTDALEFRKVTSSRSDENGHAALLIEGEVANVSRLAQDVPKLKVTLQDSGNRPLKSMIVTATDERLPPGASVPFRTIVADPGAAAGAVVTFEDSGGK